MHPRCGLPRISRYFCSGCIVKAPRIPRGHVARAIAEGKRPFLTCTVAADTFHTIDRIANALHISRGRLIDAWACAAAGAPLQPPAASPATVDAPEDESAS